MNLAYLSKAKAQEIDNLMPGFQNELVGSRLRIALNLGMGIKDGRKWYADVINGVDNDALVDGHSWETAFKTMKYAVARCSTLRAGDVIFVAPGKYQENVMIYNHPSLKIIAPWGPWETQVRASDEASAARLAFTPIGGGSAVPGVCFAICCRSVEIEGFALDSGGGYGGIYIGDGYPIAGYNGNAAGARLRGCLIPGGTSGLYGIILDGCSDNNILEDNVISQHTGAGLLISNGINRSNQRAIIRHNDFIHNAGYGILMNNDVRTVGFLVKGNSFIDGASAMTRSCLFQGAGRHAFVGNFDASANGALGSSTDVMSGNFERHTMDSPVYVAES